MRFAHIIQVAVHFNNIIWYVETSLNKKNKEWDYTYKITELKGVTGKT